MNREFEKANLELAGNGRRRRGRLGFKKEFTNARCM